MRASLWVGYMEAKNTTVLDFLKGCDIVFAIPPFQRNYEWDKKNCEELFLDIVEMCQKHTSHYIGNITYYVGKSGAEFDEYVLIDGQQRITTILLFLCALRTKFSAERQERINRRYLKNDTDNDAYRVRLKQTLSDDSSFQKVVEGRAQQNDDKDNSRITQNYFFFLSLISNLKDDYGISADDLLDAMTRLEMVYVDLQISPKTESGLKSIQTVFEKINSTGMSLTPADLLRNYLLICDSVDEQKRLYITYWVPIEQKIKTADYIAQFIHDYLVLQTKKKIAFKDVYTEFKRYILASKVKHEEILKDMKEYSVYYGYFLDCSSKSPELNRLLVMLKTLKADDAIPVYLYMMRSLYNSDCATLVKLFTLLRDYILRYRIVAPATGGEALRAVLISLLIGFISEDVKLNYNSVLFELSNSATYQGRFPDNVEFTKSLLSSSKYNFTYSRIVFAIIEEYISGKPAPLETLATRYVLPAKLTREWGAYIGSNEKAADLQRKWGDSIGNIALISINNKVKDATDWSRKRAYFLQEKFECSKYFATCNKWNEQEIEKRGRELAAYVCDATTNPLPRTRYFSTIATAESGTYPASDDKTDLRNTKIRSIHYNNKIIPVAGWTSYFATVCALLFEKDAQRFIEIADSNIITKTVSTLNFYGKDPIITKEPALLQKRRKIEGTEYYCESCFSANNCRVYVKKLLEQFGCLDDFSIVIEN